MILVNNPGDWGAVYRPLAHAEWHGCTLTDLIFPFFLFIVGVSMTFSFTKRSRSESRSELHRDVLRRSAIILALGWLLSLYFHVNGFSYPGMEEAAARFNLHDRVYPAITPLSMLLGPLVVFLFCLLASLYPALRLFRLQPVDAMRAA